MEQAMSAEQKADHNLREDQRAFVDIRPGVTRHWLGVESNISTRIVGATRRSRVGGGPIGMPTVALFM